MTGRAVLVLAAAISTGWAYAAFNGHNYAELAKKHDMHERSLRKLLDRVKKRMAAAADRRTKDLFND